MTEDRFRKYAYLAIYGILLLCLSVGIAGLIVGIILLCNGGTTVGMPYFITGLAALLGGAMAYYMYLRARWAEQQQQHDQINPVVVVMGIPVAEPARECAV